MRSLVLALVMVWMLPGVLAAEKRLGLVIGNDSYRDVPQLELARADARAISDALSGQGFEILTLLDGSRRDMNRTISEFTHKLEPGDTAFVFFAGHGVEIDGENYLLPTDIALLGSGEQDFVKSESIALSALLDRVRATGTRTTIAVIDACRENPFATAAGRSIGRARGLGRITAPQGTFVIFSAGAGQLALDRLNDSDTGRNSVFTRLFLPRIADPELELRPMMSELRTEVRALARTVNHDQFPAYYDELLGEFFFATAEPASFGTAAAEPGPDPAGGLIREDFALARSIGSVEAYDAFLERYAGESDDFTVQLARQLRDKLAGRTEAPAPAEEAPVETAAVQAAQPANRRDIIRLTQEKLNTLNCKAGSADGIAGRRTRDAFARFGAANTNVPGDASLGSQAALDAVSSADATACPVVARTAEPAPGTTASASDPAPAALSLSGTWSFSAKCALFVQSRGTVRFRQVSGNFYQATISDNLGNNGHAEVYLNGRDIVSTEYFPGITNKFHGRLAPDGQSYSGTSSNTCAVYARRN